MKRPRIKSIKVRTTKDTFHQLLDKCPDIQKLCKLISKKQ
jgi:hypothetical protein